MAAALALLLSLTARTAEADPARVGEVTRQADDDGFTDEGPGIDPAEHASVFERYHHRDGGTGIGPAIVGQVAEAYGGVRLTWPLGPDGGTRFTLLLPASMGRRTRMVDTETGRGSS